MGKTFDKVGVSLIVALLSFLLFRRLTDSLLLGVISSLLLVGTIGAFLAFVRPRAPKRFLSKRNFVRYVLLNGSDVLREIVENSFGEGTKIDRIDGHTVLTGEEKVLIYYAYKFGSLSEEDVAKSYRLAQKEGCAAIYALTAHLDRKAIAVSEYVPQVFTVIGANTLYKYLLKRGLVPPKEALEKKKGKAIKLFRTALNAANTKYYVWAGLSTALLALFMPITTYYIVFAFLNLALAVASLALSERNEGRNGLFKE